jgi:hypothetical protein
LAALLYAHEYASDWASIEKHLYGAGFRSIRTDIAVVPPLILLFYFATLSSRQLFIIFQGGLKIFLDHPDHLLFSLDRHFSFVVNYFLEN